MFIAWLEDETIDDGILWNVPTANDAADKHVDEYAIPHWLDLGRPAKLRVRVQRHDEEDPPIETYDYDIESTPQRSMGRFVSSI
jgi:hypothetical protein